MFWSFTITRTAIFALLFHILIEFRESKPVACPVNQAVKSFWSATKKILFLKFWKLKKQFFNQEYFIGGHTLHWKSHQWWLITYNCTSVESYLPFGRLHLKIIWSFMVLKIITFYAFDSDKMVQIRRLKTRRLVLKPFLILRGHQKTILVEW